MPIYEYECTKCGHRFERMQKVSDDPVKRCPECRSKVERLISSPAIRFKGSGWYLTDYSDKGKALQKEAEREKPKSDADSGKADKTDTKAGKSGAAADKTSKTSGTASTSTTE